MLTGDTHYAVKTTIQAEYAGYTDWFLPSIDELNQIYINLYQNGIGGFSAADYWSSTYDHQEIQVIIAGAMNVFIFALKQSFSSGVQSAVRATTHYKFRAVRRY